MQPRRTSRYPRVSFSFLLLTLITAIAKTELPWYPLEAGPARGGGKAPEGTGILAQRSPQNCQPGWALPQAAAPEVLKHMQQGSYVLYASLLPQGHWETARASPPEALLQWGSEAIPQSKAIRTAKVPSRIRPPQGTSAAVMVVGGADSDPQTERLPQSLQRASVCLLISTDCPRDSEQSRDHCSLSFRQGRLRFHQMKGSVPSCAASRGCDMSQTLPLGFPSPRLNAPNKPMITIMTAAGSPVCFP